MADEQHTRHIYETVSSLGRGQHSRPAGSDCGMQGGGSTFDLLSGWDAPSSLLSALRGVDSFDSPGDIISARPIEANGKQERVRITLGIDQGFCSPGTHASLEGRKGGKRVMGCWNTLMSEILLHGGGSRPCVAKTPKHRPVYSSFSLSQLKRVGDK